jgi:hypothetical protein
MYYSSEQIKQKLQNGIMPKEMFDLWFEDLENTIKFFYNDYYDESESDDENTSEFDDLTSLTDDIVKSLNIFVSHMPYCVKKNNKLLLILSKLITCHIFDELIVLKYETLIDLFDFINWDCALLFEHVVDCVMSEEEAGNNIIQILQMAKIFNRKIRGCKKSIVVYALLMAVYYYTDILAEKFIIENNIKLTKKLRKLKDVMMYDIIAYFEELGYDLRN